MTESEPRPLIDVIVPVHGAGPVFRRCAASVIAHAALFDASFRLVIVLDGPPDAESLVAVEELRAVARREVGGFELSVLTHEAPLGFVLSVNHALRGSTHDAVLLNSDTQVTAGWLGRLRDAAYSDPKIATVTPFSNNATICSLPRFLDENAIPAGHTIDSFGALVTRVSRREYPRLPTGVGFCLYVKRSVFAELGLLDEAFGLGYGEEVDLCLRAAGRGYVHVLDDATFIFHEGSRSFGRRRERRMQRGERTVLKRYPDYLVKVAEFIKQDPIAPARARVLEELRRGSRVVTAPMPAAVDAADAVAASSVAGVGKAREPRRVLHVVGGWPPWADGKTERYAQWLVRSQIGEADGGRREVFVYARIADPDRALGSAVEYVDSGVRVRLIVNNVTQRNPLSRFGIHIGRIAADFEAFLDDVRPDLVHVHHLAGHGVSLLDIAHRRHLPIVFEVRDWWPLCARGNLIDRDGVECSGPRVTKCAWCLPVERMPAATSSSMLLYAIRARTMRAALAKVDGFVMGSQSMADGYAVARVLPASARVYVLPGDTWKDAPDRTSDRVTDSVPNGAEGVAEDENDDAGAVRPRDGGEELKRIAEEVERIYEEVMSLRPS